MLYQRITIKVKGRNCKSVRGSRALNAHAEDADDEL